MEAKGATADCGSLEVGGGEGVRLRSAGGERNPYLHRHLAAGLVGDVDDVAGVLYPSSRPPP